MVPVVTGTQGSYPQTGEVATAHPQTSQGFRPLVEDPRLDEKPHVGGEFCWDFFFLFFLLLEMNQIQ